MDPRLLRYYNRELQHVREMGAEFAQEFPKIAGRLGLEGFECADPYVERLLEGFAFLTARIQLKMDAEFPVFTQNLLDMVYPHFMAPVPSIAVVQLKPDLREAGLAEGLAVARGTALHSVIAPDERTASEYRTAHELRLWPLELKEVRYHDGAASLTANGIRAGRNARAGISLGFAVTAGVDIAALKLDSLPIFLAGSDTLPQVLYEHILANAVGVMVRGRGPNGVMDIPLPAGAVQRLGFSEAEALIPYGGRSFSGYRLLQEYFSCPERFLFVNIGMLLPALRQLRGDQFELVILLDRTNATLQRSLAVENFRLFCTPAINLFPQRLDRIHLEPVHSEYHLIADRTRPLDFEIYGLSKVEGYGDSAEPQQRFYPFYSAEERTWHSPAESYYTVRREPRALSARSRQTGHRSSYIGSELFLSLVDGRSAPISPTLRQLGIEAWCTNRDLPLGIPVGRGTTDFTLTSGAPVESIRCVAGPKKPRAPSALGETSWRLLSHLSLNYLSLVEPGSGDGARAIREMLTLYCDPNDASHVRQIQGIKSIGSQQIVRRLPVNGPITYGRGLEITVTTEESAFEGAGAYLLGSVLEEFFARYVTLNSFTEAVLVSVERGAVARWPARIGRKAVA